MNSFPIRRASHFVALFIALAAHDVQAQDEANEPVEAVEPRVYRRSVVVDNSFSGVEPLIDVIRQERIIEAVGDFRLTPTVNLPGGMHVASLMIAANEQDESKLHGLWEKVRAELEESLRTLQSLSREREEAAVEKQLRQLREQREVATREIDRLQREYAEMRASVAGAPDQLREELIRADAQLREVKLEQVSVAAEQRAIEAKIDQTLGERRTREEAGGEAERQLESLQKEYDAKRHEGREKFREADERDPDDPQLMKLLHEVNVLRLKIRNAELERNLRTMTSVQMTIDMKQIEQLNVELSQRVIQNAGLVAKIRQIETTVESLRRRLQDSVHGEMLTDPVIDAIKRRREAIEQIEKQLGQLERQGAAFDVAPITIRPLAEVLDEDGEDASVEK